MSITTTTWDPLQTAAVITLSPDLLSGSIASGIQDGIAKATNGRNVGRWYFEVVCVNTTTKPEECAVGVGLGDCGTGAWASRKAKTYEWWGDGVVYYGWASKSLGASYKYVTNDVLNFAVSLSDVGLSGSLWVGRNGTWWSDPVTGTAFLAGVYKPSTSTWLPIICPYRDSKNFRGVFGSASFTYPAPTGYLPWEGTAEVTPIDPDPLLVYTGAWNNGTDSGTVILTDRVLQIGDITESLMNGAESRGWVMQAAVTLDDSDQFWAGSFAQGNHWLAGTFTLQQQFDGTWAPMLVGYVEPTDYTHDYGNREVSIQITSVLARVSYALVPYGVNERGTYDPYRPLARLMGTVSAVGTDGTVTLEPAEVQTGRIPHHSFIWQDVNGTVYPETGEQARLRGFVPENITSESGTVREMTFENGVPDWCTVGQVVYASEPWPTQTLLENEVSTQSLWLGSYDVAHPLAALWADACRQAGLTFEAASLAEFGTRLAYYQMACTAHVAAAAGYYAGYPWSNGTSPYYYGGEKWTDVLTDLFSSVGANWTVNGAGQLRAYLYQPGAQEPSGSLSFLNAYGDWTAALQEGASEVRVYSDYDPVEGYQGSYSLNTGASGPTVTINARWQRSTGGPLLASRLRFKLGSTGPAFGLVLDGTQWPNYQPGQTWTITDMPAELLPVTGSNLVIASKTYSYANDTTTLDFITGAETTGIFRTGTIGTAPEPSTLDGTDILW